MNPPRTRTPAGTPEEAAGPPDDAAGPPDPAGPPDRAALPDAAVQDDESGVPAVATGGAAGRPADTSAVPEQHDTVELPLPPPDRPVEASADARLAALEAENARLRARLESVEADVSARGSRTRRWLAVALVAIGALLAPLAVVSVWAERTISDTDRYLETVAPLADNPEIQAAIINRTTQAIMANVDVSEITDELGTWLASQGAPPRLTDRIGALEGPLTSGVETVVTRVVTRFVTSDAFNTLWTEVNRVGHTQLVAVLEGDPDASLQLDDEGNLTLQLRPVIDAVKTRLIDAGLTFAARLPAINPVVPIGQADALVELRSGYELLHAVGTWLPWIALAFLTAGVLVAPRRKRMLVAAGLALVGGMLLLAVGLAFSRGRLLEALPPGSSTGAATELFDGLVRYMRAALRTVAAVGLVVALLAFLAGGSVAAVATRQSARSGFDALRSWGEGRGISSGPFGVWLGDRKSFLRWVVVGIAVLVVLLADEPTPLFVVVTTVVALIVVGLIELLARPATPVGAPLEPTAVGPPTTPEPPLRS